MSGENAPIMDVDRLKSVIGKKVVKVTKTYDWTILTFEDGTVVKIDYFEIEKEEVDNDGMVLD